MMQGIGQLLLAKETDQKPSQDKAKSQGLEYRRLLQQWDQLVVKDGILWRCCVHPHEGNRWLQLVIPLVLREAILKEAHT